MRVVALEHWSRRARYEFFSRYVYLAQLFDGVEQRAVGAEVIFTGIPGRGECDPSLA